MLKSLSCPGKAFFFLGAVDRHVADIWYKYRNFKF